MHCYPCCCLLYSSYKDSMSDHSTGSIHVLLWNLVAFDNTQNQPPMCEELHRRSEWCLPRRCPRLRFG